MKNTQQSIRANYLYNTIYQCLTFAIPIITTPYLSRCFGVNGVGIYSYTNSIASYCILFGALGTTAYGQREVARERGNIKKLSKIFWEIALLKILSVSLSLVVWLVLVIFSGEYSIYYTCFTIHIVAGAFDISWFYQGCENFKKVVLRNIFIKFLGIVCLFIFVKDSSHMRIYIMLLGIINFLGNISMWLGIKEYLEPLKLKKICITRHIKEVLVYFIPTIATSVYTVLDKTMIGFFTKNMNESAYYEQANKIITIGKTAVDSFSIVMMSRISFLYKKNDVNEIKKYFEFGIQYILFISIPITLGICAIAHNLVPWFFGVGYEPVERLLYMSSPLIVIVGMSTALGRLYLTPSGQRGKSSKVIVCGSIINVFINSILIPQFGALGAIIASVMTEAFITGLYIYMSKTMITINRIVSMSWKKIGAAFCMMIFIMSFNDRCTGKMTTSIEQVVFGIIVYVMLLIVLRDETAKLLIKKLGRNLWKREKSI